MSFAGPVTLLLVSYTASSNGHGHYYPSSKRPRRRVTTALLSSRQMAWTAWGLHAEGKKIETRHQSRTAAASASVAVPSLS